jgi:hypothetical protein
MAALAVALALVAAPVFAQGGSTVATLNGVVMDNTGGLTPGATVVVSNEATGEQLPVAITNAQGAFSFPGLAPGTYKVTVTLQSFKTHEATARLQSGANYTLTVKLEVGAQTETITVVAQSDLVRTDTPTVSTTVNADFIQTLPRNDRNALGFLPFLPGVTTIGSAQTARNGTTISGLPENTFNITIDGVTNSNLLQSNDGFFSLVVPRLDAVEEVTLTTASAGADASGQGAVQIRFVTRSGTNRFETSLYFFLQHRLLNSNTYFNRLNGLDRPELTNYTYGGRIGGPIVLPGFDGRGKAFFFFNQEEVYSPIETARSRTFIRQSALDGNYCWNNGAACQNVLTLAAANGQVSTYDPTVLTLLEAIRAATGTTGTIEELVTSPNTATFRYLQPSKGVRHTPTTNITVNLSPRHRLQGSYYWQYFNNTPDTLNSADPTFPGFPAFGDQSSFRTTASMSLRSTLSTSVVNELRGGWQWSPVGFFINSSAEMFANQGGFALGLGTFGLTNAHPARANSPSERNTANWTVSDTLNWLKGSHSMTFGGDFTRVDDWAANFNNVPTVNFGFFQNGDPADSMFSTGNFPGASAGERNGARALYAVLTGRITSIGATGRLNEAGDEYVYNGSNLRRELMDEYAMYVQDVWRWKPTVTLTAGLRYQLQMPMTAKNGVFTTITHEDACGPSGFGTGPQSNMFCNMFNPGDIRNPTSTPEYIQYSAKSKGYNTDYNNFAPNVGIAWRPNVQDGWLRALLGNPELATINGGYTRSYNRERLDRFLTVFNGNPGQSVSATRSTSSATFDLVLPGESYPVLYRETSRLGQPDFQRTPMFPLPASFNDGAWIFDPNIVIPYTDSWNVSFQRELSKDMVGEIRYVGNTNRLAWTRENWNAVNVYETGWINGEFELAQQNLRANVLAGIGPSFAYRGPGTGTSPLPTVLAHLNGRTDFNNAGAYVGVLWTSSSFTGNLDPFDPNPHGFARTLYVGNTSTANIGTHGSGLSTRLFNNAMAVGYPQNHWVLNPLVSNVDVTTNSANKDRNNQVILQLRRRLAQGLAAQVGYTYSRNYEEDLLDFHLPRLNLRDTGVPHAIQTLWTYDIPVGRGKRFGANMNAVLDGIVGGWTFSGTARFQRQSFVIRNAVLVGMTRDEAQAALQDLRFTNDPNSGAPLVFNFPEDIYTNTRLAFDTDPTSPTFYAPGEEPTGPEAMLGPNGQYRYFAPAGGPNCNFIYTGDCGTEEIWFLGRWFSEMDFRLAKQFQLPGRARFELSAEIFNALLAKNFTHSVGPGTGSNTFRTTSTQSPARTAQIVWRVSW